MKKIIIGFFAVLLIAATAFAAIPSGSDKLDDPRWYEYQGGPIHEESSYILLDEPPMCNGEGDLCAVQVNVVNGTPDFSSFIQTRGKD